MISNIVLFSCPLSSSLFISAWLEMKEQAEQRQRTAADGEETKEAFSFLSLPPPPLCILSLSPSLSVSAVFSSTLSVRLSLPQNTKLFSLCLTRYLFLSSLLSPTFFSIYFSSFHLLLPLPLTFSPSLYFFFRSFRALC